MLQQNVLRCSSKLFIRVSNMPSITIRFDDRDTLLAELEAKASQLGITTEQLVLRFVSAGMQSDCSPSIAGESIEDFFARNGVFSKP
ncbi:hypothetical protein B4O99_22270 [Shewanella xiamenensis]|jgi:hypothetical protein|uniref:Uncharacterized protein n=2 Tax=Shewanella TaxID=22 RepID=A0A5B8R1X2_9GAMM|nr:hypothetical protein [Shewanella xiamenensis]